MLQEFGLKINEIKDSLAYFFGADNALPKTIIKPDGNWEEFLPTYEPQFNTFYDTYGCTVFGTLNAYETMMKHLQGVEYNFSERFNYILAGITPPGADPHYVAETIRKFGVIPEADLPMTDKFFDYCRPIPMTKPLLNKADGFPYQLKHEYVWNTPQTPQQQKDKITECLKYSPLGVTVTAWFKGTNGAYIDNGYQNTHWCVLYGVSDKGYLIFDSYDQSKKVLSFDHKMRICKRFQLVLKTPVVKSWWLLTILNGLLAKLKELMNKIKPTWLEIVEGELGNDFTDDNRVPDSVSCAYALTTLLNRYDKRIPVMIGTFQLNNYLLQSPLFERVPDPVIIKAGDIVISPTGTGKLKNGHCGVYINKTDIVSNDSETGLWSKNWTRQTWHSYFSDYGQMPIRIYRLKV